MGKEFSGRPIESSNYYSNDRDNVLIVGGEERGSQRRPRHRKVSPRTTASVV